MYLLYTLAAVLGGDRLEAKWKYLCLKISVLFFLVPLPFMKNEYRTVINNLFPENSVFEIENFYGFKSHVVVFSEGKPYMSTGYQYDMILVLIWILAAVIIMGVRGVYQYKKGKRLSKILESGTREEHSEWIQRKFRLWLPVELRIADRESTAFTYGLVRPVIVVSQIDNPEVMERVIAHEAVHIKRRDIVWNILSGFALILHWFNPIAYLLYRELEVVREMSCDGEALAGASDTVRKEYAKLLVSWSSTEHDRRYLHLSGGGKMMEKRIGALMTKKKKMKKRWSVALVAAMIFINSFTVFAYKETVLIEEGTLEQIESFEKREESSFVFIPYDELIDDTILPDYAIVSKEEDQNLKLLYDTQFVDEEGNIYQITDQADMQTVCIHNWVSGIIQQHRLDGKGGCTLYYFDAVRCTKCGQIKEETLTETRTYVVCPHTTN